MVAPLGPSRAHVMRGLTAQRARRVNPFHEPIDVKAAFSKAAGRFSLIVDVLPKDRIRTSAVVRVHRIEGGLVGETKPVRVRANANDPVGLAWEIDSASLPTGHVRIDLLFDTEVVWRTFAEITP